MNLKKPKFWDLKKPSLLAYFLLPLTFFVLLNNIFLNFNKKKKYEKIKTICVGNIYLGGTGKTPLTIKLYQLFKGLGYSVTVGKKYYKSQKDEQEILSQKTSFDFHSSRRKLIENAINNNKDLIIFDDGLQDRTIEYDVKFVCFDADQWVGNGFLIPSGPLREKIKSLKKYDAVFLKRNDRNNNIQDIKNIIKDINPKIRIFCTFFKPVNIKKIDLTKNYIIFSGIGNHSSFRKLLYQYKINILDEIIYPDHFNYDQTDINHIVRKAKSLKAEIITTEKDFTKISKLNYTNIYSLNVDLEVENKKELEEFLLKEINEES